MTTSDMGVVIAKARRICTKRHRRGLVVLS